jgi:hypothetical protein
MRNILPRASCVPGGKHARKGVFRTLRCGILSSVALSATISQLCSAFSVSQTLPTRGVCISLDCYRYTAPIFFPARQSGEDNRTPGKGRCLRLIWASFFFQKSGLDLARERGGEWQRLCHFQALRVERERDRSKATAPAFIRRAVKEADWMAVTG